MFMNVLYKQTVQKTKRVETITSTNYNEIIKQLDAVIGDQCVFYYLITLAHM